MLSQTGIPAVPERRHRSPPITLADMGRVARAVAYLSEHVAQQPDLTAVAAHAGLSPAHFQRLFTRVTGLSPKSFLQAMTIDRARALLADSASVLETAHAVGLSGGSRLHDLFVGHEAMPPGLYKARGAGLEVFHGIHPTPFGPVLASMTSYGLAGIAFVEDGDGLTALARERCRLPAARWVHAPGRTGPAVERLFGLPESPSERIRVTLIGTDFEVRVWEALLRVPMGAAVSYGDLAREIGRPTAARAVGNAVGRNPLAFVVPCHRVLPQSGGLGGYRWGVTRKRALLGWELGRLENA